MQSNDLKVDESSLTGESDQVNMILFKGENSYNHQMETCQQWFFETIIESIKKGFLWEKESTIV